MQVDCTVHGDLPDAGTKCSFFSSTPVTLEKIRSLFPFEGTFHFRIKHSGSDVGLPDIDYVWLDLADPKKEIHAHGKKFLEIRALAVEIDRSEKPEYDYSEYLSDISKEIPDERQNSCHPVSERNDDKSSSSFGKALHNIKQSVAAAPINMDTVKAGASSIWKAIKSTASHIQQATMHDGGSALSQQSVENLTDLSNRLAATYSDSNTLHVSILEKLFCALFPGQQYARESLTWKQAGFQKSDPVADLKTSGVLALQAMIGLCETYPERTQRMLASNRANTKSNYPFAIVGVNLTLMLAELFHLKDHR